MTSKAWYKKPEMIVALSALVVSLVTTVVSIYSATTDRAYAKASVWPRIEIYPNYSGGSQVFSFSVKNNGTGPAIVKHALISYADKPIKVWRDIPELPDVRQSHISTRILSPQQQVEPIRITGMKRSQFIKLEKEIKITLCYCSIYEECWLTDRSNNPVKVKQCKATPSLLFEN
ncbi:MAG: hypothetical protein BM565_11215 [Gammaproteobacteria bacterium MedPE]|nr:MAG: hypothetical protein BM565_11215 [Gammaproteobacteria bacterium MedPE]